MYPNLIKETTFHSPADYIPSHTTTKWQQRLFTIPLLSPSQKNLFMVRFSLKVRRTGSPNASAARSGAEVSSRGGPDAGSSSMGFQSLKMFFCAGIQFDTPVYSIYRAGKKRVILRSKLFPAYPYTLRCRCGELFVSVLTPSYMCTLNCTTMETGAVWGRKKVWTVRTARTPRRYLTKQNSLPEISGSRQILPLLFESLYSTEAVWVAGGKHFFPPNPISHAVPVYIQHNRNFPIRLLLALFERFVK